MLILLGLMLGGTVLGMVAIIVIAYSKWKDE